MIITFLGTGTSVGVPMIGCKCETCLSPNERDRRLRASILIEHEGRKLIIDTSTDFRQQALRAQLDYLDAILITHCHADHVFGLDDIRPINFRAGALSVFASERTWHDIQLPDRNEFVKAISSGNFVIKRQAFFAVGGFNEKMISCEDDDLGIWLNDAGFKLYQARAVRAIHAF